MLDKASVLINGYFSLNAISLTPQANNYRLDNQTRKFEGQNVDKSFDLILFYLHPITFSV